MNKIIILSIISLLFFSCQKDSSISSVDEQFIVSGISVKNYPSTKPDGTTWDEEEVDVDLEILVEDDKPEPKLIYTIDGEFIEATHGFANLNENSTPFPFFVGFDLPKNEPIKFLLGDDDTIYPDSLEVINGVLVGFPLKDLVIEVMDSFEFEIIEPLPKKLELVTDLGTEVEIIFSE